jgi:translocation and assembly module TamB
LKVTNRKGSNGMPRWAWSAWLLLGLITILAALMAWTLHSQAGTRVALSQVPGLQVTDTQGTLGGGDFSATQVVWQRDGTRIAVDQLSWQNLRWSLSPSAKPWLSLSVDGLVAEKLVVNTTPSTQTPPAPTTLRGPVAFTAKEARLTALHINDNVVLHNVSAQLALGTDAGAAHRIANLKATWQQVQITGNASVGADAPMPVAAQLQGRTLAQAVRSSANTDPSNTRQSTGTPWPWQGELQISGPLAQLSTTLNARGMSADGNTTPPPGSLQVQTTVSPFTAWPLTALKASLQQVDLAAFVAGAPSTQIQGQATFTAAARDAPLTVDATLQNDNPGRWDEQRLPAKTLTLKASGTLADPDTIQLQALNLVLHQEAGRISGEGRWAAQQIDLNLQATALRPVALDKRWAAMTLSGPVTLGFKGVPKPSEVSKPPASQPLPFEATVGANINGRLDSAAPSAKAAGAAAGSTTFPTVQLTLDAVLSKPSLASTAFSLTVPRWSASAAGSQANGRASAQRNDAGALSLQTNATWANFDPLPWYPGEAGSAWHAGGHRLDGQLRADIQRPANTTHPRALVGDAPFLQQVLDAVQQTRGEATLTLDNSRLSNVPLQGQAEWRHPGNAAANLELRLQSGSNTAQVKGQLTAQADQDRWQANLQTPQAADLAPLFRLVPALAPWQPQAGGAQLEARMQGRWPRVATEGTASLTGAEAAGLRVRQANLTWRASPDAQAPLQLNLDAKDLSTKAVATSTRVKAAAGPSLSSLLVNVTGTLASHRLEADATSSMRPPAWSEAWMQGAAANGSPSSSAKAAGLGGTALRLRGEGAWATHEARGAAAAGGGTWTTRWADLRLGGSTAAGAPPLLAAQDLKTVLRLGPQRQLIEANLEPGSARLVGALLAWQQARWQRDVNAAELIDLQAQLEPTAVSPWLARLLPNQGWSGDLHVGGKLNVRSTPQRVAVDAVLERQRGDLMLSDDGVPQALGLTQARLGITAQDGVWQITQALVGNNLGVLAGAQTLRVTAPSQWPNQQTPLTGALSWRVDNLGALAPWLPAGWRATGDVNAVATLSGVMGAPEYNGTLAGQQLTLRNALDGVDLREGSLRVALRGDDAKIEELQFKGGDGTLRVEGGATFGTQPVLRLRLLAKQFQLLGRVDRRIVLSGDTTVEVLADALRADGAMTVDEGLIDLSRRDAPTLDSDVNVVRRGEAPGDEKPNLEDENTTPVNKRGPLANTRLNVQLNLGPQLKLKGRGINTRLAGLLTITSPNNRLAVNGAVRAESGTYSAYGQNLAIERGVITFSGAVDNPRLDIAAERPNIDVRVGVAIAGTAQNPRVRLFSEPEMNDTDKLSWLMLGRAPEGLGRADTALLQRAALALWAGEDGDAPSDAMLKTIGLDELSVRQTETGDVRDTVIRVGKQIGRRWYVGYERGVNTSTGTWQVVYRLAQRLTVRAQSGSDNSLDAIWTWRWDE